LVSCGTNITRLPLTGGNVTSTQEIAINGSSMSVGNKLQSLCDIASLEQFKRLHLTKSFSKWKCFIINIFINTKMRSKSFCFFFYIALSFIFFSAKCPTPVFVLPLFCFFCVPCRQMVVFVYLFLFFSDVCTKSFCECVCENERERMISKTNDICFSNIWETIELTLIAFYFCYRIVKQIHMHSMKNEYSSFSYTSNFDKYDNRIFNIVLTLFWRNVETRNGRILRQIIYYYEWLTLIFLWCITIKPEITFVFSLNIWIGELFFTTT